MINLLKRLLFILPRLVFETLSSVLMFLIAKSIFNNYDIGYIVLISFLVMITSYLLNQRVKNKGAFILGMFLSFIFASTVRENGIFQMLLYTIFYFYIWTVGLKINVSYENSKIYMKKFFFYTMAMLMIMMTIGLGDIYYYINELSLYFVIYSFSVMLYIGKLNVEDVYSDREANEIKGKKSNKYKGIIINIFIVFLIVVMVANVLIDNAIFIQSLVETMLKPIAYMGERFAWFVESRIVNRENVGDIIGAFQSSGDSTTEMLMTKEENINRNAIDLKIILQTFFIIFSLIALLLYYFKLNKREKTFICIEDDFEEVRENVFSMDYFINNIINKVKKIWKKTMPRNGKVEDLNEVRRKYKKTIEQLIQNNYLIDEFDTPDEIMGKINYDDIDKFQLAQLTKDYKINRYFHLKHKK
ncbi:MAG: hypothetical protein JW702_02795 [Clostridiales bacterium]|nr:hypothetical protein [Clostridiales bacterium]